MDMSFFDDCLGNIVICLTLPLFLSFGTLHTIPTVAAVPTVRTLGIVPTAATVGTLGTFGTPSIRLLLLT